MEVANNEESEICEQGACCGYMFQDGSVLVQRLESFYLCYVTLIKYLHYINYICETDVLVHFDQTTHEV
jgi:hypothetical protein